MTSAVLAITAATLTTEVHGEFDSGVRDASPVATAAGALIGGAVGMALGAHMFNQGCGSGLRTLGGSAGVVLFGITAWVGSGIALDLVGGRGPSDAILWTTAATQVVVVTAVQARTSSRVSVSPVLNRSADGVRAGLNLSWQEARWMLAARGSLI